MDYGKLKYNKNKPEEREMWGMGNYGKQNKRKENREREYEDRKQKKMQIKLIWNLK